MESVDVRIGKQRVVVHCATEVVPAAKAFMETLRTRSMAGEISLRDGAVVPCGWAHIVLRETDGDLVGHEPNYAGNPLIALREDCSTTFSVHAAMIAFTANHNKEPLFPRFSDRVIVRQDWAHTVKLSVTRGDDGAWRISSPDLLDDARIGTLRLYDLLRSRPSLLAAMAMPKGTTLEVNGDTIVVA